MGFQGHECVPVVSTTRKLAFPLRFEPPKSPRPPSRLRGAFYPLTSCIFTLRYMQDEQRRTKREGRGRFGHAPVARADEGAPGPRAPGGPEYRVLRGGPVRLRDHGA